ncbi:hypothetical protein [Thermus scotoductus]|uniref:hypothetical protein n=1 Tax=Thermus scotoductus TaxID=37636 RepID=UPI0026789D21
MGRGASTTPGGPKPDRSLGGHGIGASVGDILAEAALASFFKASGEDLGRAPHAHPSLPEILKEAARAASFRISGREG